MTFSNETCNWEHISSLKNNTAANITSQLIGTQIAEQLKKNERIPEGVKILIETNALEKITVALPSLLFNIGLEVKPFKKRCYSAILSEIEEEILTGKVYSIWFQNGGVAAKKMNLL